MAWDTAALKSEVRRRMAELRLKDYSALATRSGVPVRTINHILSGKPSRSRYALEVALGWQVGSIEEVLNGGEATLTTSAPPVSGQPVPVGAGIDPEVLARASDLKPDEVQRVLAYIDGIKAARGTS